MEGASSLRRKAPDLTWIIITVVVAIVALNYGLIKLGLPEQSMLTFGVAFGIVVVVVLVGLSRGANPPVVKRGYRPSVSQAVRPRVHNRVGFIELIRAIRQRISGESDTKPSGNKFRNMPDEDFRKLTGSDAELQKLTEAELHELVDEQVRRGNEQDRRHKKEREESRKRMVEELGEAEVLRAEADARRWMQRTASQARKSGSHVDAMFHRDTSLDEIRFMSGLEFERYMAAFLRGQGYTVKETKASGDRGIDLLLSTDTRKIAVQLKNYSRPVGNKAVQETFTGWAISKADEAWLITTSSFTQNAINDARDTGVRLIDGRELGEWIKNERGGH